MRISLAFLIPLLLSCGGLRSHDLDDGRPQPLPACDPDRLAAGLADPRPDVREAAARDLAGLGEAAVPALLRAADHPDPAVRARADAILRDLPPLRLGAAERRILDSLRRLTVTLEFQDQPLAEVVDFLRDYAHVSMVLEYEAAVRDPRVTLRVADLPLQNALNLICARGDLAWILEDRCVKFVARDRLPERRRAPPSLPPAPGDEAAVAALRDRLDRLLLPADLSDIALGDLVDHLREFTGVNIVVAPEILDDFALTARRISLVSRGGGLATALRAALAPSGLTVDVRDRVLYIARTPEASR